MLLFSLLSGPCPWSGQLWSVAVAVTCLALWIRHSLTVLSLLYGRSWISLLVLVPLWIILFMCSILAFTCRSTPLACLPLPLYLRFGRVVLSYVGFIAVSSSCWAALYYLDVFSSHCRFSIFSVRPYVMPKYWPIRAFLPP